MSSGADSETRHSFCRVCVNGCAILVQIEDGRAAKVTADPANPVYQGYTCFRGRALPELMYDPQRELHSTALGPDGTRVRIGAEQAMDEIADRLHEIIDEHGPDSVALYTGMAVSKSQPLLTLAHSFADGIGVTRRWSANTLDQPGKQIAHGLHGYWMAPPQAFDEPEVVLWIGINPLMSYMGLPMGSPRRFFKDCERRGTTLIMIDPRRTEAARRSTKHLQPRPGEDVAILACLVRVILDLELYDRKFVAENVEGVEALREAVAPFSPEVVAARADVAVEDLLWTARTFAAARRGYAVAGTGPNMGTAQGTVFEYLVLALDTLCGHYLRAGEVVRTPGTLAPGPVFIAQAHPPVQAFGFEPRLRFRGFTDTLAGLPTSAMAEEMLTPGPGRVRALFVLNGNPASTVTDQLQVVEALESLELLVTTDITLGATARRSHYNLAPRMQLEVPSTKGDFPPSYYANSYLGYEDAYAHYTPALVEPPAGAEVIEEWELYYGLARRLGVQLDLTPAKFFVSGPPSTSKAVPPQIDMVTKPSTDDLLALMARGSRVPLDEVKAHPGGALFPPEQPFVVRPKQVGWTGRLDVGNPLMMRDLAHSATVPDAAGELAEGYEFRLLCRRTHQINSALHQPAIHKGRPYNPAFLNPADMARLGLSDGDLAEITSARAATPAVVLADPELRPGTISMSHAFGDTPEHDHRVREIGTSTNRLLSNDRVYDRYSGQPLMSNVPVNVRRLVRTGLGGSMVPMHSRPEIGPSAAPPADGRACALHATADAVPAVASQDLGS